MPSPERPPTSDAPARVRRRLAIDGVGWVVEGPADLPIDDIVRAAGAPSRGGGQTLGEVVAGAAVGIAPRRPSRGRRLAIVAGPDSGRCFDLPSHGPLVIGRSASSASSASSTRNAAVSADPGLLRVDDPSISARHCEITIDNEVASVRDCGSTNGTFLDGRPVVSGEPFGDDGSLRIGRSTLRWKPAITAPEIAPDDFDPTDGTFPVMRPPVVRTSPPNPIAVPVPSSGNSVRFRVRPASIIGPLVGGLALALLVNPKLAVLALLSPVMMLLNLVDDRRSASRERRNGMQSFATSLATFNDELVLAATVEASRRRRLHVDLDVVQDRAVGAVAGMWGRRVDNDSGWAIRVGQGDVAWAPPLGRNGPFAPAVVALLQTIVLDGVPITVDAGPNAVATVVGPRSSSVLRALTIQLAGGFGPSNLTLVVLDSASDVVSGWARWLPHAMPIENVGPIDPGRTTRHVVVVQHSGAGADAFVERQRIRELVPTCAFLVGVRSPADVPTETTTIVDVSSGAGEVVVDLLDGGRRQDLIVDGSSVETAEAISRAIARWRDPMDHQHSRALPERVSLYDIVGVPVGASRRSCWSPQIRRGELAIPLGIGPNGIRWIDFVTDGPHALIAGTTGSGKSELLRTLVTSLALRYSPGEVTFVLIDYKGGSAFAECVDLPHTVGMVTDLDDGLAARALTCLEAELRYREHVLREAEARDLASYDGSGGMLPRLVVVIDELAALIRDLPSFVGALVSLAQRGRSLGLHLVLATQRPAGTINDAIRANTNLRIALRVQDGVDSVDVIGDVGASMLDRRIPGRALIRLGPGEVSPVQVASVSIPSERRVVAGVCFDDVRRFATRADEHVRSIGFDADDETLESVARRLRAEAHSQGTREPRRPWLPPLPHRLPWASGAGTVPSDAAVGVCDAPSEQRQERFAVDLRRGGIGVIGSLGSGVSSTLHSVVVALAAATDPGSLHVYVIEFVGRDLEGLAALPHTGAVVGPHEDERRERLLNLLDEEVTRRRRSDEEPSQGDSIRVCEASPLIVVVVDGWSAARSGTSDASLVVTGERIQRLAAAGANVGIRIVVGTDRATSLSSAMTPLLAHRWVLSPSDHQEAALAGVRFSPSAVGIAGRAVVAGSVGCELQVFHTGEAEVVAVDAFWAERGAVRSASSVGVLPTEVTLAALQGWPGGETPFVLDDDAWEVPFGVASSSLERASLVLRLGEPVLLTGPPRSGRTTALATIARSLRALDPAVAVVRLGANVGGRNLADAAKACCDVPVARAADLRDAVTRHAADGRRVLVLIDDADRIDDDATLRGLLDDRSPLLRIVIAARPEIIRTTFGHWASAARRTRQGIALRPNLDVDGEVWHTPFPRRLRIGSQPGAAAFLIDGAIEVVQVAIDDGSSGPVDTRCCNQSGSADTPGR